MVKHNITPAQAKIFGPLETAKRLISLGFRSKAAMREAIRLIRQAEREESNE